MNGEYEEVSQNLEKLENNLITVINDLKASTEIILKELTGYLNVSAHDLSEIRSTVIKVETVLDSIKDYISKLDNIEREIYSIKPIIAATELKIINEFQKLFQYNNDNFKKLVSYVGQSMKKLDLNDSNIDKRLETVGLQIKHVGMSFKETKEELIKNQEGLYKIINTLVSGQNDVEKAQISLQGSKIKTEAEIQKNKLWFIVKIVGIFFSSGGILFFVIKSVVEMFI